MSNKLIFVRKPLQNGHLVQNGQPRSQYITFTYHILVPLSGPKQREIKTISSRISFSVPDIVFCPARQNKDGRHEERVC